MSAKRLTVTLHPHVYTFIVRLHATGLYGRSIATTARELLLRSLREELNSDGLLAPKPRRKR